MKELEKTKRISISGVLIIGLLLIGFLGFKMPKNVFKKTNMETLAKVSSKDYFIDKVELFSKEFAAKSKLIDIRSTFEYNKAHFDGAINIPTGHLLVEDNIDLIKSFSEEGNSIVLYGANPDEANAAWILLYQLDIPKLRLLSVKVSYVDNKFITEKYVVEQPKMDYTVALKQATGIAIPDRIAKEEKEKVYIPVYVQVDNNGEKTTVAKPNSEQEKTVDSATKTTVAPVSTPTKPKKKKRRKLRRKKKKRREGGC